MRRRKAKTAPVNSEAAAKKEREILRKEREASKKRMEAKKAKGYSMTNPVQSQIDKRRSDIMTNNNKDYKREKRGKLA